MLQYAWQFDTEDYDTIADALNPGHTPMMDLSLPQELQNLDSATLFICDSARFMKVDTSTLNSQWYDPDSREVFIITSEPEICPAGLKTRLALHPGPPMYYVIILCPPVLTQTDGQPKMYGTLDGLSLANSRPDSYILPITPITAEVSMNLQSWAGMHIDQLRERTLSVYIGRYILHIQAQKYASRIASDAGTSSKAAFTYNRKRELYYR